MDKQQPTPTGLTHLDEQSNARMVDVSAKPATERIAVARADVTLSPATLALVREGRADKGDVLAVARVAGIMAAKRTPDLIPLCHPIMLSSVDVDFELSDGSIEVSATARTTGPTGVEMEAMTAASVAALTIYDMVKGVERGVTINAIRLVHKSGGKSGTWERED
jgi:cyclic pyranopterin monophosphate synthase